MNDKELLKKLKKVFIQEARERLTSMSSNLISLEQGATASEQTPLFEGVYRDAHSLKGASRSIGLTSIESVFQIVEDICNEIKDGKVDLTPKLFDILQDFIKTLNKIINSSEIESPENIQKLKETEKILVDYLKNDSVAPKEEQPNEKNTIVDNEAAVAPKSEQNSSETSTEAEIDMPDNEITTPEDGETNPPNEKSIPIQKPVEPVEPDKPVEPKEETEAITPAAQDTVRISSKKLDSLLLKSENMIRIKQMFYEHTLILSESLNTLDEYKQISGNMTSDYLNIKQDLQNTEGHDRRKSRKSLERVMEYIENINNNFKSIENTLKRLHNVESENQRNTEKIVDGFLYDVKEIAMLPFSNILYAFPIMVREISKKLEKNIKFTMKGEEIKLDRRILQEIKDPLVHLIRNSIDHGIEEASDRKETGKHEKGNVELIITQHEGNKILITVKDDGKGLNVDVIKETIIDNNLLPINEVDLLKDSQILEYIFHSGFSTKEIITDLSGRGLGLAIVKDKVESLGGKIIIDSKNGEYSEIQIILPVTLATFKGVLVKTDKNTFVIPSNSLEEAVRVESDLIKTVENKRTIYYNKTTYPLVRLSSILGLNGTNSKEDKKFVTAAIIAKSNELMALEVDEIIEEQEILIKDLGSQLKKVKNITGATILNSGEIVAILNVNDLFKSAINISEATPKTEKKSGKDSKKTVISGKRTMLVVEDSITSRILLKNILESAGYIVETGVDGVDALTVLKSKKIDLVVSDIEMPRMDGFTLTTQIRATNEIKNIPVVLVTSRSAPEDKEKGADVGANAYIVKSDFDQTSLLDTIKTLL